MDSAGLRGLLNTECLPWPWKIGWFRHFPPDYGYQDYVIYLSIQPQKEAALSLIPKETRPLPLTRRGIELFYLFHREPDLVGAKNVL
jgi:hypothetical protein